MRVFVSKLEDKSVSYGAFVDDFVPVPRYKKQQNKVHSGWYFGFEPFSDLS